MANGSPRETLRFGEFELNVAAYELRRAGRAIRLERQPMDLLIILVQRRGELVAREEIVERLWGKDVFVDVETGVHTAVRKIRRALGDSPEAPTFVETVSGKGYRFIGVVEAAARPLPSAPAAIHPPPATIPAVSSDASGPASQTPASVVGRRPRSASLRARLAVGVLVLVLIGALAWFLRGAHALPGRVTIAVLPFENLGADADRAYLAEGLTEEIIAWLGQVDPDRLGVVSRTSAALARREARSLGDLGRTLGADYLLESSVRAESGRVRITARLVRVADQVQVWSQLYTRELTSMLGLQQELGAAIAEQVRFRLSPERFQALARRQPRVAAAYDEYLRGLTFANQRTPATTRKAIEHYERATSLDPEYALAWSALALARTAGSVNSDIPPLDVTPRVRDAVERAIRSNPDLSEAQHALGYVKWILEWDPSGAEAAFRRAIDLDPRNSWAYSALGHALSQSGRHGEALAAMRRARELDPENAMLHALSAQVAFQARDNQAALEHASQAIALEPELWIGYMMRGQAYEQSGQPAPALEALAIAARFSDNNSKPVALTGYILARTGRRDEARDVLTGLESQARTRYVPPYALALVNAGLGDEDAAFTWLDRAVDVHDVHLMYLPVDPKWDPLRSDPRFDRLLARCGLLRR